LDGGTSTASARTRIANDDLGAAAALAGPVEPLGNAPGPTSVLAQGAEATGAEIPGSVSIDEAGNGIFDPAGSAPPFDPLRTPVAPTPTARRASPSVTGFAALARLPASATSPRPTALVPAPQSRRPARSRRSRVR